MTQPASLAVHWSFSAVDYSKLVAGFEARSMDDRWEVHFVDSAVRIYRSWSGYEIYNFMPLQVGNQYKVEGFNVEENSSRYRRGYDEEEPQWLVLLLERILGVNV